MSDYLFRGKRADNGEWVYGLPYKAKYGCISSIVNDDEERFLILPETVGQYTGLTDKNGIKIFEGDVIKSYIVGGPYDTFQFPNGVLVFESGAFRIKDSRQSTPLSSYAPRVAFEVIGNIYDNPELLEVEE